MSACLTLPPGQLWPLHCLVTSLEDGGLNTSEQSPLKAWNSLETGIFRAWV